MLERFAYFAAGVVVIAVVFCICYAALTSFQFNNQQTASCVARGGTYMQYGCWVPAPAIKQ